MDRLNRVTKIEEFRLGDRYFWLKDHTRIGPYQLAEINYKEQFVKMRPEHGTDWYTTFNWRGRYISAYDVSVSCLVDPSHPGRWTNMKAMMANTKRILETRRAERRTRPHGEACGNCDFYEHELCMCMNDHNQYSNGDFMRNVAFNSWCGYWKRAV